MGEGSGVLVETEGCALILVPVGDPPRLVLRRTTPQGEAYRITVQLFIYTALDGERIVRDIKEQEVFLGRPEDLADRERLVALWQGLRQALGKRLGTMSERAMAQVDILMPYDLLPLKRLLERRTFRTTEQFARAALGKSYLGRVLPEA